MGSPSLIIADEPTSALDADRQDAFIALLMEQCRATGATLVFVSHHQGLASRFDRVIPLREIQRQPQGAHHA
jgi:putative ABC transport system ATP-binding protein